MTNREPLPDTRQTHSAEAEVEAGAPALDRRARATVVLRSRASDEAIHGAVRELAEQLPAERRHLSPTEFAETYGASPEALEKVEKFAAAHGLDVVERSAARRAVEVSGSLERLQAAFGVEFVRVRHPRRDYRSFHGLVSLPTAVADSVEDVLGLDNRPIAAPLAASGEAAPELSYTDPRAVAEAYDFPDTTGKGQCIGIVEFGGGYREDDLRDYFAAREIPMPGIQAHSVAGRSNAPADPALIRRVAQQLHIWRGGPTDRAGAEHLPSGPAGLQHEDSKAFWNTVEATLDPQVAGTLAPGASFVVYFAPDTAHGKFHTFTLAIEGRGFRPDVISCSWGSCENQTPAHVMRTMDRVNQLAALRGITICASSGDFADGRARCGEATGHFPASSPHTLACGGTHLVLDTDGNHETVWCEQLGPITMASGGGFSSVFEMPDWQRETTGMTWTSGRGFPDVAAKADVMTGYDVLVGGIVIPMGGTSAAAPLWAALVARLNESLGCNVGFLTPLVYSERMAAATRSITEGSTGVHSAGSDWDPCTGWGSPRGREILERLRGG